MKDLLDEAAIYQRKFIKKKRRKIRMLVAESNNDFNDEDLDEDNFLKDDIGRSPAKEECLLWKEIQCFKSELKKISHIGLSTISWMVVYFR